MSKYDLSDPSYGIDFTGATDPTAAIAAAWTSIPAGSKVYIPAKGLKLTATIAIKPDCEFYSDGWDYLTFFRDSDYGDTFTVGDETSIAAGASVFRDMAIEHGSIYIAGSTTLKARDGTTAMKATSGAHIRMHCPQHPIIKNCRLWRMPYQIYFHGGSLFELENNQLMGVWDDVNVGCQEGIAGIVYDVSTKWGNPQLARHTRNHIFGPVSSPRTISYDGINKTISNGIGMKQGVLFHGMEVGNFDGDYFGGMNQNALGFQCVSGGFITDISFSKAYFDSTSSDQIYIKPDDNSTAVYNLSFHQCSWNGQLKGGSCLFILPANGAYPGNHPSVYGLSIKGGFINNMPATPFRLLGVRGFEISGMKISNYNCYNSSTTDVQWCAAGWIDWQSSMGQIHDNQTGGAGETFDPLAANGNFAHVAWSALSGANVVVDRNTHITPV